MRSFAGSRESVCRRYFGRRHRRLVGDRDTIDRRLVIQTLLDDARLCDETVASTRDRRDVGVVPWHFSERLPELADDLTEIVLLDGRIRP